MIHNFATQWYYVPQETNVATRHADVFGCTSVARATVGSIKLHTRSSLNVIGPMWVWFQSV
jgi:hypothetical protein